MAQIFNHETEGEITNIKDTSELKNWISHLEYFNTELEYLVALVKKHNSQSNLIENLESQQKENKEEIAALFQYAPSISDSQECDDVDCDIFYLNKHEEYRDRYQKYIASYRKLKTKVFENLLN